MAAPNIQNSGIPLKGNPNIMLVSVVASLSAASAATATNQNLTAPGVLPGDVVLSVGKKTVQAGLSFESNVPVTVADTVPVTVINPTAGSITPTAGDTYSLVIARFAQSATAYEGFN